MKPAISRKKLRGGGYTIGRLTQESHKHIVLTNSSIHLIAQRARKRLAQKVQPLPCDDSIIGASLRFVVPGTGKSPCMSMRGFVVYLWYRVDINVCAHISGRPATPPIHGGGGVTRLSLGRK